MKKVLTLCMVMDEERVLLGMKKRGFGAGRFNGFGGKVEVGESIVEAAIRELGEEVGLVPVTLVQAGVLTFTFADREDVLEVHVFRVSEYTGESQESDEMRPEWFLKHQIPFASMWADDELWFPYLLDGRTFEGSFHFDTVATQQYPGKVLQYTITEGALLK
jgi:8-oxo-dGTP pyrophosphatase MutT (NUDIX family)